MTSVTHTHAFSNFATPAAIDKIIVICVIALLSIGLIAMSSASVEFAANRYNSPFFHLFRYSVHLAISLILALIVFQIPMSFWQRSSWFALLVGFVLLIAVLVFGREINGSKRWLSIGPLTLQCSEFAKVCVILYLSGYLVRRQDELRSQWRGFIKPMVVLFFITLLLLLEPDFGATVVTLATAFGMIFLAGVKLGQFFAVVMSSLFAIIILVAYEPYRLKRWTAFIDPFADPYNSGYQLIQSLIAFGRGEWFGVGLGNSVQKLFYLPEAHTDFVFAIFAEEFGAIGALSLLALFAVLTWRIIVVARRAELSGQMFSAYTVYGIAIVLSSQVFINVGVNTGLLPTKGLTLPFLSYGGSSLMMCCICIALVLRVHKEAYVQEGQGD